MLFVTFVYICLHGCLAVFDSCVCLLRPAMGLSTYRFLRVFVSVFISHPPHQSPLPTTSLSSTPLLHHFLTLTKPSINLYLCPSFWKKMNGKTAAIIFLASRFFDRLSLDLSGFSPLLKRGIARALFSSCLSDMTDISSRLCSFLSSARISDSFGSISLCFFSFAKS